MEHIPFFGQFTNDVTETPKSHFWHRKKKNGGSRLIGTPNDAMSQVQKRLLAYLLKIAPMFFSSQSVRGGSGSVKNARAHTRGRYVFKIDFHDAFGSTRGEILAEMIARRVVYLYGPDNPTADEWHSFLKRYALTRSGGLIQGAHTSPILLEWYCEVHVDRPIRALLSRENAKHMGIVYTRYVDDLVFSNWAVISARVRRNIREIIDQAGYLENHWKTVVVDLAKGDTVRVTGPRVLRQEGRRTQIGMPRKDVKVVERMLTEAIEVPLFGEKSEVIEGKVKYLLEVSRGKQRLNALETRTLRQYILWCKNFGKDATWAMKTLERKAALPQKKKRKKRP